MGSVGGCEFLTLGQFEICKKISRFHKNIEIWSSLQFCCTYRAKFGVHIHVYGYQLSTDVTSKYLSLLTLLEFKIVPYFIPFQAKIVQC